MQTFKTFLKLQKESAFLHLIFRNLFSHYDSHELLSKG